MLCQKITWVSVAVLCVTLHIVSSLEISCRVTDDNRCIFNESIAWDGDEDIKITNPDELVVLVTDVVLQAPFQAKVIPIAIFDKFPNMKSLKIVEVGLEAISRDDFVNAKQLTHLYIENNNFVILKSNLFTAATNLVELDLSNNRIVKIEDGAFEGLNELTKLSLSGNKVVDFDIAIFTKLPKLIYLIVSNMDYKFSAPYNADEMAKIVALNSPIKKLDLSNNPIDSTDLWRRLSIFPNLEVIYFTANKITKIDYMDEFKQLLPHVTQIVMDENPFEAMWLEEAKTFFEKLEVNFKYE